MLVVVSVKRLARIKRYLLGKKDKPGNSVLGKVLIKPLPCSSAKKAFK